MASGSQQRDLQRMSAGISALGVFVAALVVDMALHTWLSPGPAPLRARLWRAGLAAVPVAGLAGWLAWGMRRDRPGVERARLDAVCRADHVGWVELDEAGRIAAASGLAADWLSGSKVPFLGHSLAEIFPLSEGGTATWLGDEHLAPRPDGPFASCPARLRALTRGAEGRLLAVLRLPATKRDDPTLRDAERRFRVLWDHSRDGLRLIDASGMILEVNDAYCAQVNKPREELVGQPISAIYPEPRRSHILATFQHRSEGRLVEPLLERQEVLWDGREVCWEITNAFLVVDDGPPRILSIFRDATRRKTNEERVRHLEAALDLVEEAVAFVEREGADPGGERAPGVGADGEAAEGDVLGRIAYVNAAFTRMAEVDAGEAPGRPLEALVAAGAEPGALEHARHALEGGEPTSLEWTRSRKDGTLVRARLNLVPALDRLHKRDLWIALGRPEPPSSAPANGPDGPAIA